MTDPDYNEASTAALVLIVLMCVALFATGVFVGWNLQQLTR